MYFVVCGSEKQVINMEKPVVNYEIISGYRKNSQLLLLNEERQIFKKKVYIKSIRGMYAILIRAM